jgi:hypothetical protein
MSLWRNKMIIIYKNAELSAFPGGILPQSLKNKASFILEEIGDEYVVRKSISRLLNLNQGYKKEAINIINCTSVQIMEKTDDEILNEPLDFDAFLFCISYFEFKPGEYTNEDFHLWMYPDEDKVDILDYYVEGENGDIKEYTIDVPKTLKEAIDKFLPVVFPNDTIYQGEDLKDLIEEYRERTK